MAENLSTFPRFIAIFSLVGGCTTLLGQTGAVRDCTAESAVPAQKALEFSADPTAQDFFQAQVFEEPLVPIGAQPTREENRQLAATLCDYSKRTRSDDFSSLARFLERNPESPWRAALLTDLGIECYKTAHYSLALGSWQEAWTLGQKATDASGVFLADRALCELAGLYSRLGRMNELDSLLKSIAGRILLGGASERIRLAHEALAMMQYQPGISFRCGPLALQSLIHSDVKLLAACSTNAAMAIYNSASTQQGFSLPQVAELARQIGLNYQMAFREKHGAFLVPALVHWKVGHYAAVVRQVGDLYLVEDPTFGNSVWVTRTALETETSGYFLLPPGELPPGWRTVSTAEGGTVWGKGVTSGIDPDNYTPDDLQAGTCPLQDEGLGMAISRVHLGIASLQIRDTPVGYQPPIGPAVHFTVRYNHRDYVQPPSLIYRKFGVRWTHDWEGYITDTPLNPLADVKYFVGGGGARTFTGFDTNTQSFAPQQLEQTRLTRTGTNNYEMLFPNGSKKLFGLRQGNKVLLTQVLDPAGNGVTLTWSGNRLVSLTDAIGQVTTLSYNHPSAPDLITKVTDPFGRFATFEYGQFTLSLDTDNNINTPPVVTNVYALTKITDVLGLVSECNFQIVPATNNSTDLSLVSLTTPYGTTTFTKGEGGGPGGTTRFVETHYPDGSRDRIEYNQSTNGIAFSDPTAIVPQGMNLFNQWLFGRNTFYWDRNACAQGYGDYSKATIYHWSHSLTPATTAGILESVKRPLEHRIWYTYAGQLAAYQVGSTDRPGQVGRVLDDGSTQLYTYGYNSLGNLTNSVDPVGRELSFIYATNGIDLLEVRQTRGANNELLALTTYNHQHRRLTTTDAAGQTTTNNFNARGQILTSTDPKGETTAFTYDGNGYLIAIDGPLPGTNDTVTVTYDAFGRTRTVTDETGYSLTIDHDALNRITRITHPDSTFEQNTYDRLDLVTFRDRAGRQTLFDYDNMRQLLKRTDPLGRVTRYQWCSCGGLGSLTDPMGRRTEWRSDIQGRRVSKQYGDGSSVNYRYETSTSRLRQVIDEKQQIIEFGYNRDDTLNSIAYANGATATPGVTFGYDANYRRLTRMTDGTGTTTYSYIAIGATPVLGAGHLASLDGPLPNDTITYDYDELGRSIYTAINGVGSLRTFDAAGRLIAETNALGTFSYGYDGSSGRLASQSFPNGQTTDLSYFGNVQDRVLQRITYKAGGTTISEFQYAHDVPAGRISTWSQQTGSAAPDLYSFGYDSVNQLLSATITNSGVRTKSFAYSYDFLGNRLSEQAGDSNYVAAYNALNQISSGTAPGIARTNEWDSKNRLVAVDSGNQRIEFSYDGRSRLASIRTLTNNLEASFRRFVWVNGRICEERDAAGTVTKRYFNRGMKVESGPKAGNYFYTRDHLGSIRELTDSGGVVRARYAYDPYGRRTKLVGDLDADFGFAGMFWSAEAGLALTHFRAYDPDLGRWMSRDPLKHAELREGPNLYAYVGNDPANRTDPEGLTDTLKMWAIKYGTGEGAALVAEVTGATSGGAAAIANREQLGLAVTELMPAVEAEAACAAEALPSFAPRMAQAFDILETQIAAIEASYPEVAPWLESWKELGKYLPSWYVEMIELDRQFYQVVEMLQARYGWTFNQAWDFLVNRVGFNPETW